MMMRPRKYSFLNRSVSKAIGRAINQHYRHNGYNSKSNNNTNSDAENVGCAVVVLFVIVIFALVSLFTK